MESVLKIVLTGGPCGGKTTAKEYIHNYFEKNGFKVIFVPESATQVMALGIKRGTSEFQHAVYENQLKNELAAAKEAKSKTLIVCDRGTMDSAAYFSEGQFEEFLKEYNSSIIAEKDRYDAVFHLESAACGAEEFYTNAGGHRTETVEEARVLDGRTMSVWVGHNHLRVITNNGPFENKMNNLIEEIAFFAGEMGSLEIEKKFLIEKPEIEKLENMPLCKGVDITQVYLKSEPGCGRRIRNRGGCCYYTEKRKLESGIREEIERKISLDEYKALLNEADEFCAPVVKKRYCLVYKGKYFELDVFSFMEKEAFLEIELKSVDEEFELPPFVKVIADVTDNKEYTNLALAKKLKNM